MKCPRADCFHLPSSIPILRLSTAALMGLLLFGGSSHANATVPAAPSELRAMQLSGTTVRLAWSDNSSDETSFGVWRKLEGGEWERVGGAAANAIVFVDPGPQP